MVLTTTEFEILHVFVSNTNIVFDHNQLLDPSEPEIINTIHGIGYSFTASVTVVNS